MALWPEGLEGRALRAVVGPSAPLDSVMDLGVVSKAAAVRGVEVAASIDAGHSVTFRFAAGAAGDYALKVRHVGEGLTLKATGPSGSSAVDPGPAGPFETLILPIREATYEIRAGASADGPVFVDWELILVSGAGQAPAVSASLVAPASIPLPGPASTAAVAPSGPSTTPASASVALGDPVGRPAVAPPIAVVGPSATGGSFALAFAGEGLPAGLESPVGPAAPTSPTPPAAVASSTATDEVFGGLALDEAALEDDPWWGQTALAAFTHAPRATPPGVDPADPIGSEPPADPVETREAAGLGSSGLVVGLVSAVVISRRWKRGESGKPTPKPMAWSAKAVDWPESFTR